MMNLKNITWSIALFVILGFCSALDWSNIMSAIPGGALTHHRPLEFDHSFNMPFDAHGAYWTFGGSTVISKTAVRLTPATQDRRGWIWNNAAVGEENWEVEFQVQVGSKSQFGGDGFGFWVLQEKMNPAFHVEHDWLSGPLVGMRANFYGFGLIFDTYDNDNLRDNPSVFVLKHTPSPFDTDVMTDFVAPDFPFNHNSDFATDMVKDLPNNGLGVDRSNLHAAFPSAGSTYKCTIDYRNTVKPVKFMVRYQKKVLHVYVSKNEDAGYQFCLAVNLPYANFSNSHFAFSAHTGQAADKHDLVEMSTRFLDKADHDIDDLALTRVEDSMLFSLNYGLIFWIAVFTLSMVSLFLTVWQIYLYIKLRSGQVNSVLLCEKINAVIGVYFTVHFIMTFLLMVSGHWGLFFLNAPLVVLRLYQMVVQTHLVDAAILHTDDPKVHGGVKFVFRLYALLAFFALSSAYYLHRLMSR